MEYEYLDDGDSVRLGRRRRAAIDSAKEALIDELNLERLHRIAQDEAVDKAVRANAKLQIPPHRRTAERKARRSARLLEAVAFDAEELDRLRYEILEVVLRENEAEHASRLGEVDVLRDELAGVEDDEERDEIEGQLLKAEMDVRLVELTHDLLLERRGPRRDLDTPPGETAAAE